MPRPSPGALSQREIDVLEWAAAGKSAADTAIILGISPHTVIFWRKRARDRLDACTITQAVAICIRRGIIQ